MEYVILPSNDIKYDSDGVGNTTLTTAWNTFVMERATLTQQSNKRVLIECATLTYSPIREDLV